MPKRFYIQYGDHRIPFERVASSGRESRIRIKVQPNQKVIVHAPQGEPDEVVLRAVNKRARWIWNKLKAFELQRKYVSPRKYVSGESHFYLGKRYLLKVLVNHEVKPQVKLLRGCLEVNVRHSSPEKVRELLSGWYREKAREVFKRRLDTLLNQTLWVEEVPHIRLLVMKTQWGSCSPGGVLTLNPYLVKAPSDCIDYVLLHELCHLAEHNHSERFYRLMGRVMTNWQTVKQRLDGMADHILGCEA